MDMSMYEEVYPTNHSSRMDIKRSIKHRTMFCFVHFHVIDQFQEFEAINEY